MPQAMTVERSAKRSSARRSSLAWRSRIDQASLAPQLVSQGSQEPLLPNPRLCRQGRSCNRSGRGGSDLGAGGRRLPGLAVAEMQGLGEGGVDDAGGIRQLQLKAALELRLMREGAAQLGHLLVSNAEARKEGAAPGAAELDGRGLVPDDVVGAEAAGQHDQEDGIDRAIHAAAESRAPIAPCSPI